RGRGASVRSRLRRGRRVDEADEQKLLAAAENRPNFDIERQCLAIADDLAAADDDARIRRKGLLDARSQLRPQAGPRHGEKVVGWPTRWHAQVPVSGAQRKKALVPAVDENCCWRIRLQHQPMAEFGEVDMMRRHTSRPSHSKWGYSLLSLTRASSVVNCQSALA